MQVLPHALAGFALISAVTSSGGAAESKTESESLATHCTIDEFSLLNARLSRVERRHGNLLMTPTGKVVSLCVDKASEPYSRIAYRFGKPGRVEFERIGTRNRRFSIYARSTSPHTGEEGVFFQVGRASYYVTIGTGQGSGASVVVFEGNKMAGEFFSGFEAGVDFQLGPADIFYGRARSPVFVVESPKHVF